MDNVAQFSTGISIFLAQISFGINKYPVNRAGRPQKPVVEVVVDYAVPDIAQYVVEVRRMKARRLLANLPL